MPKARVTRSAARLEEQDPPPPEGEDEPEGPGPVPRSRRLADEGVGSEDGRRRVGAASEALA